MSTELAEANEWRERFRKEWEHSGRIGRKVVSAVKQKVSDLKLVLFTHVREKKKKVLQKRKAVSL